jgi:DNA-binding CsgD family transcriptional regulator
MKASPMLDTFSQSVDTLYGMSKQVAPASFRAEILRLIRNLVNYDGALFKIGSNLVHIDCDSVTQLTSSNVPAAIFQTTLLSSLPDALHSMSKEHTGEPIICSNSEFIEQMLGKLAECKAEGVKPESLLAFGNLGTKSRSGAQWIIIYRRRKKAFDISEGILLQKFWIHIARAISFNLIQTMNSSDPSHRKRAMGMLNQDGILEVADAHLNSMLKEEWEDFDGYLLPAGAFNELRTVGRYRGAHIELLVFETSGYFVCEAKRTSVFNTLAPKEKKVAYLFASGISYGEIANQLGVSPHTVRNQLAQIYQKLAIHSKIELAKIIQNM